MLKNKIIYLYIKCQTFIYAIITRVCRIIDYICVTIVNVFKLKIDMHSHIDINESFSPIQCIIISGNDKVKRVARGVQNSGFDVRPIMSPTVPEGKERLRICLHTFNTEKEVNELVIAISESI